MPGRAGTTDAARAGVRTSAHTRGPARTPTRPRRTPRAQVVINILEHFPSMPLLLLGRVLGGISTSLLFSAFEAWLVSEHRSRNFPEHWLERTFSLNGALNGIMAIAAGLLAQVLTVNLGLGNIGPFQGAIALTVVALLQITPWSENYGDQTAEVSASLSLAVRAMRTQPSLWLLGLVQSLFEGAMYTFVFNWVPMLEPLAPASAAPFPHGLVFACFMLCIASGSTVFELMTRALDSRHAVAATLIVSTLVLATPVAVDSFPAVLAAFLLFEACVGAFGPGCATLRSRCVAARPQRAPRGMGAERAPRRGDVRARHLTRGAWRRHAQGHPAQHPLHRAQLLPDHPQHGCGGGHKGAQACAAARGGARHGSRHPQRPEQGPAQAGVAAHARPRGPALRPPTPGLALTHTPPPPPARPAAPVVRRGARSPARRRSLRRARSRSAWRACARWCSTRTPRCTARTRARTTERAAPAGGRRRGDAATGCFQLWWRSSAS